MLGSVLLVSQRLAVESAPYDDACIVVLGGISPVPYWQQDVSPWQVDALGATGIGVDRIIHNAIKPHRWLPAIRTCCQNPRLS